MVFDLNNYPLSSRNGTYGGKAGSKEGIIIDGENWLVKYPKSTKGMRGTLTSYTTAPLSEYIGSNIYDILGIEAHRTELGVRNGKLVVACKDFCKSEGALREIRTLKNIYNQKLNEQLEANLSSTSDSHLVDLEDILIHLDYNPVLGKIPEIKERFWAQVLIDVLINNNDRNNGNWGILYDKEGPAKREDSLSQDSYEEKTAGFGSYTLAPVFDNGSAFSTKLPDSKLSEMLEDAAKFAQSADMSRTVYALQGKPLYAKDLVLLENDDLYKSAANLVPLIQSKMDEIAEFINRIPECYEDIPVCSDIRKCFYIRSMEYRLEHFLLPVYDKAVERGMDIIVDTNLSQML